MTHEKTCCRCRPLCYSLTMKADSIINDDFNATLQSDEFATEFEKYLDEQEEIYWHELETRAN